MENPDTDQWNRTVQQILDRVCNHPPKAPFPRPLCQALALLAQALFSQLSATSSVKHEWSLRKVASDLEQCCDALSLPAERLVTASKPWEMQATPDFGCFLQVCAAALRGSVKMKFLIFGCMLKWKTMEVNLIGGHAVTCSPSFPSSQSSKVHRFFQGMHFFLSNIFAWSVGLPAKRGALFMGESALARQCSQMLLRMVDAVRVPIRKFTSRECCFMSLLSFECVFWIFFGGLPPGGLSLLKIPGQSKH